MRLIETTIDIQAPTTRVWSILTAFSSYAAWNPFIIAAEGEALAAAALGEASDTMMSHPLALQLRNLQTLVEIGVDKNTTVVFPAPLMSTIQELGAFLNRETTAVAGVHATPAVPSGSNGPAGG